MSVLDLILAAKFEEIERLRSHASELRKLAAEQPPARPFAAALRAGNHVALIAEFKRRSPSADWIRRDGSVAEITKAYSDAGARAISVLTDRNFFAGALADVREARAKTFVPILRKEFVVDELQLYETRAAGADAVLLIVRALDPVRLRDLLQTAGALGLDALVEAHDEAAVECAVAAGATVVGINNRDLSTFQVDRDAARRMARAVPPDVVLVAESGIRNPADVRRMGEAGIDAVLVGEALMRAPDVHAAVHALANQPKAPRA